MGKKSSLNPISGSLVAVKKSSSISTFQRDDSKESTHDELMLEEPRRNCKEKTSVKDKYAITRKVLPTTLASSNDRTCSKKNDVDGRRRRSRYHTNASVTTTAIMIMMLILEPVTQSSGSHRPGVKATNNVIAPQVDRSMLDKSSSVPVLAFGDNFRPNSKSMTSSRGAKLLSNHKLGRNYIGARMRRHIGSSDVVNGRFGTADSNSVVAPVSFEGYAHGTNGGDSVHLSTVEQMEGVSGNLESGGYAPSNYASIKQSNESSDLFEARERILDTLRDTSRKYAVVEMRDPVILIHTLQSLIRDITWSMLEELKK